MPKIKSLQLNKTVKKNVVEKMVNKSAEELDKLNEELKKVLELKTMFIADVTHEFRTSLTIMQCSLELISKNSDIKEENLELFDNVITEIKRISATLTDLTILTSSHFLNLRPHYKIVDLGQRISLICNKLNVVGEESNINIKYTDSAQPIPLLADVDDIDKILMNLIRNAIRYNVKGGWVKVSTKIKKKGVCLFVQDSGIGISKRDIPRVFERFYRVDKSRTRKDGGSGLGLAICKHTIEMYGGKISVKSKVGQGSLFTLYFPNEVRGEKTDKKATK